MRLELGDQRHMSGFGGGLRGNMSGAPRRAVAHAMRRLSPSRVVARSRSLWLAIVYAAQVDSKLRMGDVAGAQAASNSAKMWGWIAFGLGVLSNGVVILLYALGAMAGARQF